MKAIVVDTQGCKAGDRARVLAQFHGADSPAMAAAWIGTLPGHETGRYGLDACHPDDDVHVTDCGCAREWEVHIAGRDVKAVWADPERKGGEPCVHGTRIPVRLALELVVGILLDTPWDWLHELRRQYPTLVDGEDRVRLCAVLRWVSDRAIESGAEAP